MNVFLKIVLGICTAAAILITYYFAKSVGNHFDFAESTGAVWGETGQVGDFVGGVIGTIVAAIGSILLYLSFRAQTQTQEDQGKQFNITQNWQNTQFLKSEIESRFFELIKLHKDNLSSLSYDNPHDKKHPELKERKVIKYINEQIESCFQEIEPFFEKPVPKTLEIYHSEYLKTVQKVKILRRKIDLIQLARIDIAYSIVFFGTADKDLEALQKLLNRHYLEKFTQPILQYICLKSLDKVRQDAWNALQKLKPSAERLRKDYENQMEQRHTVHRDIIDDNLAGHFKVIKEVGTYNKYYGGHQYKLGQYFRHLFQTVKYINKQQILNYLQQYDYIKTLRAQLSNTEQYLLFFNSLSFMGRAWELSEVSDPTLEPSAPTGSKWLITKYNFIKNVQSLELFNQINISEYYPNLHFEFEEEPATRMALVAGFTTKNEQVKPKTLMTQVWEYIQEWAKEKMSRKTKAKGQPKRPAKKASSK